MYNYSESLTKAPLRILVILIFFLFKEVYIDTYRYNAAE